MGFSLLYEGMLDSIIWARDNLMLKGGLIFPERAKIFVGALDDRTHFKEYFGFYTNNPY
jgi:protein arginine N-methyltransferase 1